MLVNVMMKTVKNFTMNFNNLFPRFSTEKEHALNFGSINVNTISFDILPIMSQMDQDTS